VLEGELKIVLMKLRKGNCHAESVAEYNSAMTQIVIEHATVISF